MTGLNPQTACQFALPGSYNFNQRKKLGKYLQKTVPTRYKGMKGKTLFFEFTTTGERDQFLSELSAMLERRGQVFQTL